MRKKKYIFDLLNKKFDNSLTAEESEILDKYFSENELAKKDFENFSAFIDNYKFDDEIEVEDLSEPILQVINKTNNSNERYYMAQSSSSSFGTKLAYAFTFIFGIILGGALIYLSFNKEDAKNEQIRYFSLFGTMGDSGAISDFVEVDSYNYEHTDLNAKIHTKYNNDMILLEYEVFSEEEVKVIFQFQEKNLQYFASKKYIENSETSMLTSRNLIQVDNKGKNRFIFLFVNKSRRPDKIKVSFEKGSAVILEGSLVTNK